MGDKSCHSCKKTKLSTEFYKNSRHNDGLSSECKECVKKRVREWKSKRPGYNLKHSSPKKIGVCLQCQRQMKLMARGFCTTCYEDKRRAGDFHGGIPFGKRKHVLFEVNEENKTATCASCGPTILVQNGSVYGKLNLICHNVARRREYSRKNDLGPACQICGSLEKLTWDHDHNTGMFRGTLCNRHNLALGQFRDNIDHLLAAVAYLRARISLNQ